MALQLRLTKLTSVIVTRSPLSDSAKETDTQSKPKSKPLKAKVLVENIPNENATRFVINPFTLNRYGRRVGWDEGIHPQYEYNFWRPTHPLNYLIERDSRGFYRFKPVLAEYRIHFIKKS